MVPCNSLHIIHNCRRGSAAYVTVGGHVVAVLCIMASFLPASVRLQVLNNWRCRDEGDGMRGKGGGSLGARRGWPQPAYGLNPGCDKGARGWPWPSPRVVDGSGVQAVWEYVAPPLL